MPARASATSPGAGHPGRQPLCPRRVQGGRPVGDRPPGRRAVRGGGRRWPSGATAGAPHAGAARGARPGPCRGPDRRRRPGERLRPRVALAVARAARPDRRPSRCLREPLAPLIADGSQAGAFAPVDPALAAAYLLTALNGIVTWYRPDGPLSARAIAAEYVNLSLRVARRGGTIDDRSAGPRSGPARARAEPPSVQPGPTPRRALPGVRGARPGRRQDRGRRLDARRVPDERPALRRDARQQRADGRPPRARTGSCAPRPSAGSSP